jgi:glycosyltransferase involved in cell wall biosynthesis
MINISFALTVCNESAELKRLFNQLHSVVEDGDEIVIQADSENTTPEVLSIINDFNINESVNYVKVSYALNKDFAAYKNHLFSKCTKDYIFQIDADEEINKDQIDLIRQVLELNPNIDCFLVPRINTVTGLTPEHIGKWGWRIDEHNRINFPDYQYRICQNKPEIKWVGAVHEKLVGHVNMALLPADDVYALGHHKSIQKQEKQNSFYNTI